MTVHLVSIVSPNPQMLLQFCCWIALLIISRIHQPSRSMADMVSLGVRDHHRDVVWYKIAHYDQPPPAQADAALAAPAQLSLTVIDNFGDEECYKIARGTQLTWFMDAYCKKHGIPHESVRFMYEGQAIDESKTPDDLEMEDDDVIDAVLAQLAARPGCRPW